MSVKLYDAVTHDGLFDLVGKAFKAQKDVNTNRGTTIPADALAVATYHAKLTATDPLERAIQPVAGMIPPYQAAAAGSMTTLQNYTMALLVAMVNADVSQSDSTFATAMKTLIAQMVAASASVNASAVTVTVTAGGSNVGTGVILASKKSVKGANSESMIGETVTATATVAGTSPPITCVGQQKASAPLGQDWPMGSGASRTLTPVNATTGGGSVLSNGGFETFTTTNVPDSWLVTVGTPGTTCTATVVEVQTVAISGTPTGGWYALKFTAPSGKVYQTVPLSFDATDSTVQSALQSLPGLGSVSVVATGTSPNYTHTITFTGIGGNLSQLTSVNNLTGGTSPTVTHATTTNGTSQVFAGGAAYYFTSNGSELTSIQQAVSLQPLTAYAVSLWACCDVVPGAGVITIDLVDGVSGSVIADAAGTNNSLTFNASALLTTFQHLKTLQASECVFRTPATLPTVAYLRIRISTAVTNTRKVFFDSVALAPMTELYAGGPLLAAFSGGTDFAANDTWAIATTNDRAGVLREWCERNWQLTTLGLALPTSGSPTVPDSVVS